MLCGPLGHGIFLGSQVWLLLAVSRLKLRKGFSRERSFQDGIPEPWSILMLGEECMGVPAGNVVLGSGVLLAQLDTTTDLASRALQIVPFCLGDKSNFVMIMLSFNLEVLSDFVSS